VLSALIIGTVLRIVWISGFFPEIFQKIKPHVNVVEGEGSDPPGPRDSTVFKTTAFYSLLWSP